MLRAYERYEAQILLTLSLSQSAADASPPLAHDAWATQ